MSTCRVEQESDPKYGNRYKMKAGVVDFYPVFRCLVDPSAFLKKQVLNFILVVENRGL
jgi:hypothetical protein